MTSVLEKKMADNVKTRGLEFIKEAIAADNEGLLNKAKNLYLKGIDHLMVSYIIQPFFLTLFFSIIVKLTSDPFN